MRVPRIVIAGTASGVGKTTVALAVMAALARRGLRVAPFKVGPDYIDPGWHGLAAGRPGRNLDPWLLPEETVRYLFLRAAVPCDVAVVEGVMGLFDGRAPAVSPGPPGGTALGLRAARAGPGGGADEASTAHVARLLRAPVVLVADAARVGRSVAATVWGFARFDRRVRVAGAILNRVAGSGHARLVREAVEAAGVPVLGCLPRAEGVAVPERHLGLVPAWEAAGGAGLLPRLARLAEEHVDLDGLLRLARGAPPLPQGAPSLPGAGVAPPGGAASEGGGATSMGAEPGPESAGAGGRRVTLAVARDEAFHFYYEDSLDLLREAGAELVEWSPLRDESLPEADGLILGGGFPEVQAERLAANVPLLAALRRWAFSGRLLYAECGGLLLLCRALVDGEGREHRLAGVLPARAVLGRRLAGFGYREGRAAASSPLLAEGEEVRGHEFHYAALEPAAGSDGVWRAAYLLRRREGEGSFAEGWVRRRVLASFLHVHLWSRPSMAARLVAAARAERA